jgi:hypothetical protein
MRNIGACWSYERDGIMVGLLTRRQNELPKERLICFLEAVRQQYDLEWEFIDVDILPSATGTSQSMFVVEICWVFDKFMLRAMPLLSEQLSSHVTERGQIRMKMTKGERECKFLAKGSTSHLTISRPVDETGI